LPDSHSILNKVLVPVLPKNFSDSSNVSDSVHELDDRNTDTLSEKTERKLPESPPDKCLSNWIL
jgi:hypothetical protein